MSDLGRCHLEEDDVVSRCHCIGVLEIHLVLAVRIFMIDLVDVDANCLQRLREPLEEYAGA